MHGTRLLRKIIHDRSGNALILAVVALPMLVGAAGLAMDTIDWTLMQRQMQREADSAALSGAFARSQGASASAAANASLTRDGLLTLTQTPVIERPPTAGSYAGNTEAVRVILKTTKTLPFSSLFMRAPNTLRVEATAASITNGTYCVISLESSSATGITMQGSAVVNMGCGLATNSKGVPAVTASGSSTVTATHVSAVGGLKATANYTSGTVLIPYSVPQADPMSGLPTPTVPSPCNTQMKVNPNQTLSFNPGCYVGVDIKGTANLAAGIYTINGGSVSFGSQAVVNGTGVTFILTSSTASTNPGSIATLSMNGGAKVNLTATTSGTYAGVLMYQDRRAPAGGSNTVNGNSLSSLQGAFYFKSQDLSFSGDSGMTTDCIQLVSRRVTFIGNNSIVNQCPVDSGAHSFVGTRVYLVG